VEATRFQSAQGESPREFAHGKNEVALTIHGPPNCYLGDKVVTGVTSPSDEASGPQPLPTATNLVCILKTRTSSNYRIFAKRGNINVRAFVRSCDFLADFAGNFAQSDTRVLWEPPCLATSPAGEVYSRHHSASGLT
jgi:hypothetical protein